MSFTACPGRLGDQNLSRATDQRTHPKLLEASKAHDLHELSYLTTDLGADGPSPDIMASVRTNEESLEALYNVLDYHVPGDSTASTP